MKRARSKFWCSAGVPARNLQIDASQCARLARWQRRMAMTSVSDIATAAIRAEKQLGGRWEVVVMLCLALSVVVHGGKKHVGLRGNAMSARETQVALRFSFRPAKHCVCVLAIFAHAIAALLT